MLVTLSTLSIYPTPLAGEQHMQVTQMEMDGVVWLTENGDSVNGHEEFGIPYFRYHDGLYGRGEAPFGSERVPEHFGYREYERFGESYDRQTYVTITERGRAFYPNTYPEYPENWRYTPADFDRLEHDRSVARLYDNGDYTEYLVEGTAGA